jgi:hypothetical protein
MVSAENACRLGRGIPTYSGITIASSGLDTTGVTVIEADTTDFIVVDALWFEIPDDVVAYDLDIKLDDYFGGQDGTPTDLATVLLPVVASVGDLRALWDWENPNPPAGKYHGMMKIPNLALEPDASQTDKVTIVGNSATAAENYSSTVPDSMQVVARARKIAPNAFI